MANLKSKLKLCVVNFVILMFVILNVYKTTLGDAQSLYSRKTNVEIIMTHNAMKKLSN